VISAWWLLLAPVAIAIGMLAGTKMAVIAKSDDDREDRDHFNLLGREEALMALARAAARWEKWEREVWDTSGSDILSDAQMSEGYAAEAELKRLARHCAP
jgi:hypothetical protein